MALTINVTVNPATTSATTVATTTASRVVPGSSYVRAVNTVPARRRARRHFRSAVCRIVLVLRRRKAWAAEGQALKANWIQDLVEGLERVRGKLVRKAIAPVRTRRFNPRDSFPFCCLKLKHWQHPKRC